MPQEHDARKGMTKDVQRTKSRRLPLDVNTDDFAFDAQMLAEILWEGTTIGEVPATRKTINLKSNVT